MIGWVIVIECGQVFQKRGWRQRFCLSCRPAAYREYAREQNRLYYHRHPEKVKLSVKQSRAKRPEYYREQKRRNVVRFRERSKRLVLDYYSHGTYACTCCNERERDFLTIDHIDGSGGKHRTVLFGTRYAGGSRFYAWLVRNHFPPGFQVLCMNCNFSKGKHGQCAHKASPVRNELENHVVDQSSSEGFTTERPDSSNNLGVPPPGYT